MAGTGIGPSRDGPSTQEEGAAATLIIMRTIRGDEDREKVPSAWEPKQFDDGENFVAIGQSDAQHVAD